MVTGGGATGGAAEEEEEGEATEEEEEEEVGAEDAVSFIEDLAIGALEVGEELKGQDADAPTGRRCAIPRGEVCCCCCCCCCIIGCCAVFSFFSSDLASSKALCKSSTLSAEI